MRERKMKRKTRKMMDKAIKAMEDPIWFVNYRTNDEAKYLEVLASDKNEAMEIARNILKRREGRFEIIDVAVV